MMEDLHSQACGPPAGRPWPGNRTGRSRPLARILD